MSSKKFKYGPLAIGIYTALFTLLVVVMMGFPNLFIYYILLLIFLGIGLRPLIVKTGLYAFYQTQITRLVEKWDRKFLAKRRIEIDSKRRDQKYRSKRKKDPRLPKNW
jgi:hypothetical protein